MTYSADLGAAVLKLRFADHYNVHRIAKTLGKSRQYVTDVIARWETQGILKALGNAGTKHSDRKMTDVILQTLRRLVSVDDSCTASEYAAMLTMEHPGEFTHLDVARAHSGSQTRRSSSAFSEGTPAASARLPCYCVSFKARRSSGLVVFN